MAVTPARRIRVSDHEWEAWRAAPGGNISAWARSLLNAAANGDESSRLAGESGARAAAFPRAEISSPGELISSPSDARPKGYRSEPFSLVCPARDSHVRGTYCLACNGDGAR